MSKHWTLIALLTLVGVTPVFGQQNQEERKNGKPGLLLTVPRQGQLINIDLDGKAQGAPLNVPAGAMEPAWSPNGKMLAFVRLIDGNNAEVFVMDMETEEILNTTKHESEDRLPAWSPDGKRILFMSTRTGNNEVFVMDADGTAVTNLSNHEAYDGDPVWSPDGKKIAFVSRRGRRNFPVFLMNPDGSDQEELIVDNIGGWVLPDWSPDGTRLAFGGLQTNDTVQLMVHNVDNKGWSVETDASGINSFARWSPDGRYIAYGHIPSYGYDPFGFGADLMIYDVENNKHRKLSEGDLPFWSPRPCWVPQGNTSKDQQ